jgi:hypothetical protein
MKIKSVLSSNSESERVNQEKRLKKRREDPRFREDINRLHRYVAGGQCLYEAKDKFGNISEKYWKDLVTIISQAFANPGNIMLEWSLRQRHRYSAAIDMMNRAKIKGDFDQELKAMLLLVKVDENFIEVQKALGFLKPVELKDDGEFGYHSGDLGEAEQRFNRAVEDRVLRKLEVQREAQQPVTIDVFPGSEAGGSTDRLDEAPLAENSITRQITGYQDT